MKVRFVCGLMVLMAVAGCVTNGSQDSSGAPTGDNHPWTNKTFQNDPDQFQFAIVSDRHGGGRPGIFPKAVEKLNMLQPEFVMSVGDLIPGYTEKQALLDEMQSEFASEIAPLGMPLFRIVGNHDIGNEVMAADYEARFGTPYYHFVYKDVLFLCLNSEDPPPDHLSEEQLAYFADVLAANPSPRWTMVFLHKPFWGDFDETVASTSNWLKFESMLQDRPYTVFAGHWHTYVKFERNGHDYYVLATTGGGSNLSGPDMGQFDHITWVTMEDEGPRVANLMLDGILPDDVFVEEWDDAFHGMRDTVSASPVWAEEGTIESASVSLTMTNPTPYPITASLHFEAHPRLLITPSKDRFTINPGEEAIADIHLQAMERISAADLRPVMGMVASSVKVSPARSLEWQRPLKMTVQGKRPIPGTDKPVEVDGDLSEWSALPYEVANPAQIQLDEGAWQGAEDSSFAFGVSRDEEHLYLAVRVMDDEAESDPLKYPWQQDAVEIRLSALPEPALGMSRGENEFKDVLLLAITPGQTEEDVFGNDMLPEGVKAASKAIPGGHATELAIPTAYLDEKQGTSWQELRLNIAVDDHDEDGATQIWWQPDWRTSENQAGSGTFVR